MTQVNVTLPTWIPCENPTHRIQYRSRSATIWNPHKPFDSESAANEFADALAKKFPGTEYRVVPF